MEIGEWPSILDRVIKELKLGEHQDFIETVMESGNKKRRAKNSPIPVLRGTVKLNAQEMQALNAFIEVNSIGPFRFFNPQSGEKEFGAFRIAPVRRQFSHEVGKPENDFYIMDIEIWVKTASISKLLDINRGT